MSKTHRCELCKTRDAKREMVARDGTRIILCDECYDSKGMGDLIREFGFREK